MLSAVLLLTAGAGATALTRRGAHARAATLTAGATAAPAADRQDAADLTARLQVTDTGIRNGPTTEITWPVTRWLGHRKPGEVLSELHTSDGTLVNIGTGRFADGGSTHVGVHAQTGQKIVTRRRHRIRTGTACGSYHAPPTAWLPTTQATPRQGRPPPRT